MADPSSERILLAAKTSLKAGGILPEAKDYKLPPLVTGLEVVQLGLNWLDIKKSGNWVELHNHDVLINLDHPDVKAVL